MEYKDWQAYEWPFIGATIQDELEALWDTIYNFYDWLMPPYLGNDPDDDTDDGDDYAPPWERTPPISPPRGGGDDSDRNNMAGMVDLGLWKVTALSADVDIQMVYDRDGSTIPITIPNAWDVCGEGAVGDYGHAFRLPSGAIAWAEFGGGAGVLSLQVAANAGLKISAAGSAGLTGHLSLDGAKWK